MADDDVAEAARRRARETRDAAIMGSYSRLFHSPDGRVVLNDLSIHCYGAASCIVPGDIYETIAREGRREVLLHIMQLANLSAEEILYLRLERVGPVRTSGAE